MDNLHVMIIFEYTLSKEDMGVEIKRWSSIVFLLFLIGLAGCVNENTETKTNKKAEADEKAMDSLMASAQQIDVTLPAFLSDSSEEVKSLYKLAYANQDVIKYMPCFCGCVNQGHQSNRNCFIQDVRKNGKVVWDKMAET